jgi:hypothetical protein
MSAEDHDDQLRIGHAHTADSLENSSDDTISPERSGQTTGGEKQLEQQQAVDEPPDGGYGWVCVVCVFLINAHTWGVNSVSLSSLFDFFRY